MKLRQFTIRTVLLATAAAAIFCAGYLAGFDNGRNARFDDLIKLIQDTITPSEWLTNGTIDQTGSGCSLVVTDDSSVADPFASTPTDVVADDPFSSKSP